MKIVTIVNTASFSVQITNSTSKKIIFLRFFKQNVTPQSNECCLYLDNSLENVCMFLFLINLHFIAKNNTIAFSKNFIWS